MLGPDIDEIALRLDEESLLTIRHAAELFRAFGQQRIAPLLIEDQIVEARD